MSELATSGWWTSYYAQHRTDPIEWYLPTNVALETSHTLIQRHFAHTRPESLRLLHIGCGSSRLADELYSAFGYSAIDNIDFAESIIAQMKQQTDCARPPTITYATMDCRSMNFPALTYDVVLDKGTRDCLALDEHEIFSVQETVQNIYKILKCNGIFISFSIDEKSEKRIELLKGYIQHITDNDDNQRSYTSSSSAHKNITANSTEQYDIINWYIECITMNQRPLELPNQEHTYCYICHKK